MVARFRFTIAQDWHESPGVSSPNYLGSRSERPTAVHIQACDHWPQYDLIVTSQELEIRRAALSLFAAWLIHDLEKVFTFPATSRLLANRFSTTRLLASPAQSAVAIALMCAPVAAACHRGILTNGDSKLFRAVTAGLEAHVATHILAPVSQKSYTAGLVTAPLVMLPGARVVRAALRLQGQPLKSGDIARGGVLLVGAALLSHVVARVLTLPRQGSNGIHLNGPVRL
jgi:hypothetical protein